jgi:hypothetical protein
MDPPPAAEGLPGDALPTAGDGNEGEKDQPELRTMLELRVTAAGGAGVLDPFPPLAINKFSKSFIHIQLATDLCRCHHRGQGGHGWAPQSYQTFLPREEVIALKSCCPKLCSRYEREMHLVLALLYCVSMSQVVALLIYSVAMLTDKCFGVVA